ncbi:hypothetical protein ENLAB_31190 [Enterococcus innesii]|uniref:Uncharacterized protein n=1 Tax=Enterococcus innesii TaxID=2839759 RepID=A0ABM7XWK6_9ENTE|nr:hypothetical protein ENLAB_31190 [Enterococcus innesii]
MLAEPCGFGISQTQRQKVANKRIFVKYTSEVYSEENSKKSLEGKSNETSSCSDYGKSIRLGNNEGVLLDFR